MATVDAAPPAAAATEAPTGTKAEPVVDAAPAADSAAATDAAAAASTTTSEAGGDEPPELADTVWRFIVQLPGPDGGPSDDSVVLAQVPATDTVLGIRQLLQVYPQSCGHSCYHLELVRAAPVVTEADVAATNAAVAAGTPPPALAEGAVLEPPVALLESAELLSCRDIGLGDWAVLALVPDLYDANSVRMHVRHVRELLDNPPANLATAEFAAAQAAAEAAASRTGTSSGSKGNSKRRRDRRRKAAAKAAGAAHAAGNGHTPTTATAVEARAVNGGEAATAAAEPSATAADADADASASAAAAPAAVTGDSTPAAAVGTGAAAATTEVTDAANARAEAGAEAGADGTGEAKATEAEQTEAELRIGAAERAALAHQHLGKLLKTLPMCDLPFPVPLSEFHSVVESARHLVLNMPEPEPEPNPPRSASSSRRGKGKRGGGGGGGGSSSSSSSSSIGHSAIHDPAARRPQCLTSISFGGWNPPPSARRLMGDLAYLEVVGLGGDTIHVTCTAGGFFVNATRDNAFNPEPARDAHHSHSLLTLLRAALPGFAEAHSVLQEWALYRAQRTATAWQEAAEEEDTHWDDLFTMAILQPETAVDPAVSPAAYGGGFSASRPWLDVPRTVAGGAFFGASASAASPRDAAAGGFVPDGVVPTGGAFGATAEALAACGAAGHTFNRTRAEDALLSAAGVDTHASAVPRDWNEELQAYRALPRAELRDRIIRLRALTLLLQDFTDASVAGAVAVLQGNVPPINPMDPPAAHVFSRNNTFYSYALDGRGAYAGAGADFAARAVSNHDLRAVRLINEIDPEDVHTLATTIVDYMGQRVVAQGLIPGILQGENQTEVVYGSADQGVTVASKPEAHARMEALGERLHMASRVVRPAVAREPVVLPDSPDNFAGAGAPAVAGGATVASTGASDSARAAAMAPADPAAATLKTGADPVPLCGAMDCKGIVGADKRHYVLDLVRTTPPDPRYCTGDAAAGKSEGELLSARVIRVLRPELVELFEQQRRDTARQAAMTAMQKEVLAAKAGDDDGADTDAGKGEGGGEATTEAAGAGAGAAGGDATAVTASDPVADGEGTGKATGASGAEQAATKPPSLTAEDFKSIAAAGKAAAAAVPRVLLNVNVFDPCAAEQPERAADEALVKEVSDYLHNIAVPMFARVMATGKLTPLDGGGLTSSLHSRGINVRCLGEVATLVASIKGGAPSAIESLETEMVARAVKRVLRKLLADPRARAAPSPVIAALLSALLGAPEAHAAAPPAPKPAGTGGSGSPGRKGRKGRMNGSGNGHHSGAAAASATGTSSASPAVAGAMAAAKATVDLTHEGVWALIHAEVKACFDYTLQLWAYGGYEPAAAASKHPRLARCARVPLLRRVCLMNGLVIACRDYDFATQTPIRAAHIVNILPVVKHCLPFHGACKDASDMLASAQHCLNLGHEYLELAWGQAEQALWLVHQVGGLIHDQAARGFNVMALVFMSVGSYRLATQNQRKTVAIYERLHGIDSPKAVHARVALGDMCARAYDRVDPEEAADVVVLAVSHIWHALFVMEVAAGPRFADTVVLYFKMGMAYTRAGHFAMGVRCFETALAREFDPDRRASLQHWLAIARSNGGDYREALALERSVERWYADTFGPDDVRAKEAALHVQSFTQLAVDNAKTRAKLQEAAALRALEMRSASARAGAARRRRRR